MWFRMLIGGNSSVLLLPSHVSSAKKSCMVEITVGKSKTEKSKGDNLSVLIIWKIMVLDTKSQSSSLKHFLFCLFYLEEE